MKNVYENASIDLITELKNNYKKEGIAIWTKGLSTLYNAITSYNIYIDISKDYYFGNFNNQEMPDLHIDNTYLNIYLKHNAIDFNTLNSDYSFNRLKNTIDEVIGWGFYSDTPIFYIYEYNEKRTSCLYNVFDSFSLTYSRFLINLRDFPKEDTLNLHCLLKEEAVVLLEQQLRYESLSPEISYIVDHYGFKFTTSSIDEQLFELTL